MLACVIKSWTAWIPASKAASAWPDRSLEDYLAGSQLSVVLPPVSAGGQQPAQAAIVLE